MIALLPVILFFTYRYSFYNPTRLVLFYVIISTKTLGFLSMASMLLGGTDFGFFTVNMLILVSIFFYKGWYRIDAYMAPLFVALIILLLYGLSAPVLRGHESFMQALTASKGFLFYVIFFYMFVRKDEIDVYKVMDIVKFVGVYISVIKIIYAISPALSSLITPPEYRSSFGEIAYYVRVDYPTYMSLATFIYYADWQQKKVSTKKFLIMFVILILGNLLAQHAALTGGTIIFIAMCYFIWHEDSTLDSYLMIKKGLAAILFIVVLFSASYQLREIVVETYEATASGEDGALKSRKKFNKHREKAIKDRPLLGFGFIHKTSWIMKEKYRNKYLNRFTERLEVTDSGYIDLLTKFGYLGVTYLLLTMGLYLINVFKDESPNSYALVGAAYILQYFLINKTWAVFSYAFGIIPLVIAFFMIYKFRSTVPTYKLYHTV